MERSNGDRIISLWWQISRGKKKECNRRSRGNREGGRWKSRSVNGGKGTKGWKGDTEDGDREGRTNGGKKKRKKKWKKGKDTGNATAARPRAAGGNTENDWPLFPPSGLNYYHLGEHCLLWRRIILLSPGRSASNALGRSTGLWSGGGERDEDRWRQCRRERRRRGGADTEERPCSFHGPAIYWSRERKREDRRKTQPPRPPPSGKMEKYRTEVMLLSSDSSHSRNYQRTSPRLLMLQSFRRFVAASVTVVVAPNKYYRHFVLHAREDVRREDRSI